MARGKGRKGAKRGATPKSRRQPRKAAAPAKTLAGLRRIFETEGIGGRPAARERAEGEPAEGVKIATTDAELAKLEKIFEATGIATVSTTHPFGIIKQALVSRQTRGK
jgi:hypothetical protein